MAQQYDFRQDRHLVLNGSARAGIILVKVDGDAMELGLKGKAAIVTASSRGIGRATAEAFAAEGARIAMCARTAADVTQAAETIRAGTGAQVLALRADLTQAGDIQELVRRTVEAYGTVDILVNNAGGPPAGTFDDMNDAEWQAAFELTLLSTVRPICDGREAVRSSICSRPR